jgi:indole-3-glycerol phosphate synthase/phosphoribosylanthranilate isomerase
VADYRKALPESCEVWATCAVGSEAGPERSGADRILYDTKVNGRTGGTGESFDWSLIEGRAALSNAFLAGGIGPANAVAAQGLGTYGIDLCSGVEASPGVKDPEKVFALFQTLRPACRRTA